jgi:hypothetical protein
VSGRVVLTFAEIAASVSDPVSDPEVVSDSTSKVTPTAAGAFDPTAAIKKATPRISR